MYLVIELQTTNGQLANISTSYADRNEAESKFHQILAAAAISNISVHSAVIIDEEGVVLANGSYIHST